MKLASWNVNGLRSAARQGFRDWLRKEKADVVCLQEVRSFPDQLDPDLRNPRGYAAFWHPAEKPGYSGVAMYARVEPEGVTHGTGIPAIDREGRVLQARFRDFVLLNAYFPNSGRDHARLGYKLDFCAAMLRLCRKIRREGKHVILCGDLNIAHREIDLENPASNRDNAGFLPEERAWMDRLLAAGFVDSFRQFTSGGGHYTWWSARPGVREKNVGWRLDYHVVNREIADRLAVSRIQPRVMGSDHCPVVLQLRR